jgi:hypothetical protein
MLTDLNRFVEPYGQALPDARYAASLQQLMVGLLAARSPHLTKAAAQTPNQTTSSGPSSAPTARSSSCSSKPQRTPSAS